MTPTRTLLFVLAVVMLAALGLLLEPALALAAPKSAAEPTGKAIYDLVIGPAKWILFAFIVIGVVGAALTHNFARMAGVLLIGALAGLPILDGTHFQHWFQTIVTTLIPGS